MGIKKYIYHLLFVLIFVFTKTVCFTQFYDTTKFVLHQVVKGETSYGIAKKYNIDLNVFFEFNTSASKGLNRGEYVKIPILVKSDTSLLSSDSLSNQHVVVSGETLWSIAKKYGVEVDLIKTYNQLEDINLSIDQVILIPNIPADTANVVKPLVKHPPHPLLNSCDTIVIHKVRRKETLYGIANLYDVSLNSILKNNPDLEEKGLQKGMSIKIIYRLKDCNLDSILRLQDTIGLFESSVFISDKLNISLLLPFMLEDADSLMANGLDPNVCNLNSKTINSIDLYNGLLIGLNELKKKGYQIDLNVFDTYYDTTVINQILEDSIFKKSNLIIGPVFSTNIKKVRNFSRSHSVPMITPFDIPNQALFMYPDLFKYFPSKVTQSAKIGSYLKQVKSDYNIILISNGDDKKSNTYAKIIAENYADTIVINDSITAIDTLSYLRLFRGESTSSIRDVVDAKKENLFVVAASDIPFLTFIFNDLLELSNSEKFFRAKFSILGFQELFDMNSIDIKYKNNFRLKFSSKGRIDYSNEKSINFVEEYQDKFKMSPQENAFLGYDLLISMISNLYPVDKEVDNTPFQGHYNYCDYKQIGSNNGFENKVVKLYEYSDYKLHQLK